jgi:LruC domain-containing protein
MKSKISLLVILLIFSTGCALFEKADNSKDDKARQINIQVNDDTTINGKAEKFQYKTTRDVEIEIIAPDLKKIIPFKVYKNYSVDPQGLITLESKDLLGEFVTNSSGKVKVTITLPSYQNELYVKTDYPGIINELFRVTITSNTTMIDYRALLDENQIDINVEKTSNRLVNRNLSISRNIIDNFSYLIPTESGTLGNSGDELWNSWDENAVPNKIIFNSTRFPVSEELFQKVNKFFPEKSKNVADTVDSQDIATNIRVVEDSTEVWVTFIHEGAGYKNVLGYYTYDKSTPPTSMGDIGDVTLVFPNASYQYGGGGLKSGDTVYIGSFPKDTVIGWVLFSNGYSRYGTDRVGARGKVTKGYYQLFSNKEFNPNEVQQMALLNHDENGESKLILAYEDILRPGGDQDFNDTVFYVTAEPEVVPDSGEFLNENNIVDPNNSLDSNLEASSKLYFPSKDGTATLAFEDLWPVKGDYDFNDLVVDYRFEETLNNDGKVTSILSYFKVASYIGAGFTRGNGFAIQLGVDPNVISNISFYTNSQLTQTYNPLELNDYIGALGGGLDSNKTEKGTDRAIILISDSIKASRDEGREFYVKIEFSSAQTKSKLGTPPYNPFIMSNGLRGREVHLSSQFGTIFSSNAIDLVVAGVVNSDDTVGSNSPYTTSDNLPWVLNIPVSFAYPEEGIDIRYTYNHFVKWASSGGLEYKDWYLNQTGYRNSSYLHSNVISNDY